LYARKAVSAARCGADKLAPGTGAGGQPGSTTLERSAKIGFKAGIGGIEQFSTGYYDDVDGRFDRQPYGLPEDLSYQPFGAIPLDRIPQLSGGHDTEPRDPAVVGGDEDGQIPALGPERQIENAGEFVAAPNPAGFREALGAHTGLPAAARSLRGRNREAFTPLGAPPLQDEPTVFRRHAHEESVRALAAPAVWLESYAHYRIPLGRKINCGET
jgi:hypothetical protein